MPSKLLSVEKRQTVLNLTLGEEINVSLNAILLMAGHDVRNVYDELEAINLINNSTLTTEEIVCLLIRPPFNLSRLHVVFDRLNKAEVSLPVMLDISEAQDITIRTINEQLPEDLDAYFYYGI